MENKLPLLEVKDGEEAMKRILERLMAEAKRLAKPSTIDGFLNYQLAFENIPYRDACISIRYLVCAFTGFVTSCPHCKRRIFFDKYVSKNKGIPEQVFPFERCLCGKWYNVETDFTESKRYLIERVFEGKYE
jgi:hypothetical protein